MRTFLAARLLENIAYNSNRGAKNLRLFEVGKVFFRSEGSALPRESMRLACAISGKEREYFWRDAVKDSDFFDLKGRAGRAFRAVQNPAPRGEVGESFPR